MNRALPPVLGIVAALTSGCPEDPVPAEDGSSSSDSGDASSGPGSSSTLGGSSTEGLDDSSTSGSTSTGSTGGDSTTGGESSGHARFLVRERIEGSEYFDLVLYEYADGELSPPLSLTPELPAGGGVSVAIVAPSGRAASFCTVDPAQEDLSPCAAIDLASHPPGLPQPLAAGPVATNPDFGVTTFVDATDTFVFRVTDLDGIVPDSIYAAALSGGELQVPQLAAEGSATEQLDLNPSIRPDGAWLGYVVIPDEGPRNAFVAPLDPPDPGAAMMVSDLVDPAFRASTPTFVPGQEAVLYSVDGPRPGPDIDSLWLVDISGPVPGAPVRVDDPLTDFLDVRVPKVAPDGHALVYWAGMDGDPVGDVVFVDLSTGVPQPPVTVSTLGAGQVSFVSLGWSPDSRLVVYVTADDIHVLDASGDTPGEPVGVTGGLAPKSEVTALKLDASSSWLYYVAQHQDDEAPQIYRVDVSGSEPGAPQWIGGGTGWLPAELIPSPDWSMMLYIVNPPAPDGRQLYLVDVSGAEPGEPVRIDTPMADGVGVGYNPKFSFDGSVVLHEQVGPEQGDPTPVRLVDLTSLEGLQVSADALGVFPVVD